jgi:hypothetical protein
LRSTLTTPLTKAYLSASVKEGANLATFYPITGFGDRFLINLSRGGGGGDGLTIIEQGLLVAFDWYNRLITAFFGCFQRFFLAMEGIESKNVAG